MRNIGELWVEHDKSHNGSRSPYLSVDASRRWLEGQGYHIQIDGYKYILTKDFRRTIVSGISGFVLLPDGMPVKAGAIGVQVAPRN